MDKVSLPGQSDACNSVAVAAVAYILSADTEEDRPQDHLESYSKCFSHRQHGERSSEGTEKVSLHEECQRRSTFPSFAWWIDVYLQQSSFHAVYRKRSVADDEQPEADDTSRILWQTQSRTSTIPSFVCGFTDCRGPQHRQAAGYINNSEISSTLLLSRIECSTQNPLVATGKQPRQHRWRSQKARR